MSGLRETKKSKIRNDIINVATKAFLENGYDKTSTKEIAKAAGIGAGTLYNYFPTKAEILLEILSSEINDNLAKEDLKISESDCAADAIYDFMTAFIKPALSMPSSITRDFTIAILSVAKKSDGILQRMIQADLSTADRLESLIDRLKRANLIRQKKDTKVLSRLIFSELFLEISLYFFETGYTKEDLHKNLMDGIRLLVD